MLTYRRQDDGDDNAEEKGPLKPKGKRGRPSLAQGETGSSKKVKKAVTQKTGKRGRPRKVGGPTVVRDPNAPKRPRGRPRKPVDPKEAPAAEDHTMLVASDGVV
jgi:hypothetical protein